MQDSKNRNNLSRIVYKIKKIRLSQSNFFELIKIAFDFMIPVIHYRDVHVMKRIDLDIERYPRRETHPLSLRSAYQPNCGEQ